MPRLRTILHPTDLSSDSANAFAFAYEMAHEYKALLVVLHVRGAVIRVDGGVVPSADLPELRAAAREAIEAQPRPAAPMEVEIIFREGPSLQVILDAAAEYDADLIVMGTHGRAGLSRLIVGSVAEDVLRKAACPVLTIKTTAHAGWSTARTTREPVNSFDSTPTSDVRLGSSSA